ncbi:response regulator transcription factor [Pseudonocardia sp.]|jgi:DNA-binding NarL/FixJ family response regulator|uniref:response regulator transcription factor n=1 Tax=Pseudonocardia sp. TaxID=60912 RepID=UPI003D0AC0A6
MSTAGGQRVVVVDDHALVATSLAVALRSRGLQVDVADLTALDDLLGGTAPPGGLVLLDLDLGDGLDGAELVPRLRRAGWRVLVVSGSQDRVRLARAVAAGAAGVVAKTEQFDVLVDTVVRVAAGRDLVDGAERERLREIADAARRSSEAEAQRWGRLTPRERQIAERIAVGRRPAVIAEEFVVSVQTVRTQVRSILGKLEVGSQLEVAALVSRLKSAGA